MIGINSGPFRTGALLTSAALLLSSCASTSETLSAVGSSVDSSMEWVGSSIGKMTASQEPLTPAEKQLREKAANFNRTIFEGMMVGAVGGAAVGAGIGAASTSNRGAGALMGAAIGAVGGAAAGAAGGYYYANMKEKYADQEERLDVMTAGLRQENAELESTVVAARAVVAEKKKTLASLSTAAKKDAQAKEEAQRKLNSVDRNIELMGDTIEERNKRLAELRLVVEQERQSGQSEKIVGLQKEIVKMEKQTALLEAELDALSSRRASVAG